ncbi:MAG: hypothetical protein J0H12_05230 [Candidatus Paracaedimonas acanthamoebae]|uniref:Flagellar motor switch protein FliG n=1 Tax=Candidatus Paracaedimonas acanthamoebae TaxID=244581 RepID=A0A8J7TTW2_9PROT|nr:hypothetical protein [Candidatus Paracaedimonas acanthamoebae]
MPIQETVRPETHSKFSSFDKVAVFLLSLPKNEVEKIFSKLNVDEIKNILQRMSAIDSFEMATIDHLYLEFSKDVEKLINKSSTLETEENILTKLFHPLDLNENKIEHQKIKVDDLSETLKNVTSVSLSKFLKDEHPQMIALILNRIDPQKAASVFVEFPEALSLDVMNRMLTMGQVQQEVLDEVENTLKAEFKDILTPAIQQNSCTHMADIFNAFGPKDEVKFMQGLESKNSEAAKHVKDLILTIEDLKYVEEVGIKKILSIIDKSNLVIALKGVDESLKEVFFSHMSDRSAKLLKEEIMALGMVKIRTVYEAQQVIVNEAKELIRKGEIHLSKTLFKKRI